MFGRSYQQGSQEAVGCEKAREGNPSENNQRDAVKQPPQRETSKL